MDNKILGFGFEPDCNKHHFLVDIPQNKDLDVKVYERYKWDSGGKQISELPEDAVYRSNCKIELAHLKWDAIKPALESFLNKNLKAMKKPSARFAIGQNAVEEELGKEMLVLLWAVRDKEISVFPTAVTNWQNLSSEERRWLYTMTNLSISKNDDNKGWRMALSYAITEKLERNTLAKKESGIERERESVGELKKPANSFGFDPEECQHHFLVRIPNIKNNDNDIKVFERYTWDNADRNDQETDIISNDLVNPHEKVVISREKWEAVKAVIENTLNATLKKTGRKLGKFMNGNNAVERLLGKEMMVLLWAIEGCKVDVVPNAIANWQALSREERWWLFTMTNATTGTSNDRRGWRMALRYALTDNPIEEQGMSLFENLYK